MTWQPYLDDRQIKKCEGYYIIKPAHEMHEVVPLACPVCDYLMRTNDDKKSYENFKCCDSCEMLWARPNQENWKAGWRPEKDAVLKKVGEKKINVSIKF